MDVSTDGFTELLLKSFFSFLLCTYFPQLLQGSRKPSQECNLSPGTSILLGPLSLQSIRQGMSPGRGALPLQAPHWPTVRRGSFGRSAVLKAVLPAQAGISLTTLTGDWESRSEMVDGARPYCACGARASQGRIGHCSLSRLSWGSLWAARMKPLRTLGKPGVMGQPVLLMKSLYSTC